MAMLPDFCERGEARAERHVLPSGEIECAGCGNAYKVNEVSCSTADPYSPPLCDQCISEMCHRREADAQENLPARTAKE